MERKPAGSHGRNVLEPVAQHGQTAPVTPSHAARPAMPFDDRPTAAPPVAVHEGPPAGRWLELLWVGAGLAPRLRRNREWRALIDAAEQQADVELEDGAPNNIGDAGGQRDAFEIIARASVSRPEELPALLQQAVRADGKLVAPLVVVAGRLTLPFDPCARLETTYAVVEPLGRRVPDLREAIEAAQPFLARPEAVAGGAAALTTQLLGEVRARLRGLIDGHLEGAVERVLLEKRAYERRDVFGEEHVRAMFQGTPPVPVYLPAEAARRLPLFRDLDVRMIAELHPRADEAEPAPCALRARCVAREQSLVR